MEFSVFILWPIQRAIYFKSLIVPNNESLQYQIADEINIKNISCVYLKSNHPAHEKSPHPKLTSENDENSAVLEKFGASCVKKKRNKFHVYFE